MVYVDHYPESGVEIFKERADGSAVLALYNNKKTSIGPDGHEQIQADVLFLNQRVKNVEDVIKNFGVYWKKLAAQARADLIANYTVAVQNMMDRTAQTRGYDSIFTLCSYANSTNPKNLFGGTWVAWGSGRVPVGINTSDDDFKTVEKTGGEKTHTLSLAEMPRHTHDFTYNNSNTCGFSSYAHGTNDYGEQRSDESLGFNNIAYTGGDKAHNNLQPYITCYMWKRTA